jgi:hypothetical protein
MTRVDPVHQGWIGSFPVRAHASGPKGHSFCLVHVRAKARTYQPYLPAVPTARTYLAGGGSGLRGSTLQKERSTSGAKALIGASPLRHG